jgi:hypothetical protein
MSMSPEAPGPADPGGTVPSEQGWEPSDADQESMGAAQAAGDEGPGNSGYGHGQGHGRHRRDDDDDEGERNVGG